MVDLDLRDALGRALEGDPMALAAVSRADQVSLRNAELAVGRPLIVTRSATINVLRGLLHGRLMPTNAQAWASLMRRGYVEAANGRGPILPIEIEFEEAWEDAIAEAVSRLDELGDQVDGEVTPGEVASLLHRLGASVTNE